MTKIILSFLIFYSIAVCAQERPPFFTYQGRISEGDSNAPRINDDRFHILVPVKKFDDGFLIMPLTYNRLHFGKILNLDTGAIVPQTLTKTEAVLQYMKNYPDESNIGFRGSIGYAGDKSLGETGDTTFAVSSHYSFFDAGKDRWTITLYFTNNGAIANYIPIPGFIYHYKTEKLNAQLGLPYLNIQWTPELEWTVSLTAVILNINLENSYAVSDRVSLLASFHSNQQTFILKDRVEDKDRLSFVEDRLGIGIRFPLYEKNLRSDLMYGRAFNRSVYVGQGFLNRDRGHVAIDNGDYLSWNLKLFF